MPIRQGPDQDTGNELVLSRVWLPSVSGEKNRLAEITATLPLKTIAIGAEESRTMHVVPLPWRRRRALSALAAAWLLSCWCGSASATLCNQLTMLPDECECDMDADGRLTLRWAGTHVNSLLGDLEKMAETNISLHEMQIRDSDLEELKKGFPAAINEHMERLTLDNTRIGQVYIGNIIRPIKNLRSLQLHNETIQQVEANMLDSLTLLEELGINEANLVTVRENAFVKLNLSHLSLRHNHLTQIPDAVSKLPFLRELDLFENPIEVVSDQEALVFQSNLKLLRKLVMNKVQCDCELGKGEFLSWIRRANISGVKCGEPPFLLGKDITGLTTKQFCDDAGRPAATLAILVAATALHWAAKMAVS